ncbi:FkbM family methyltransferase [Hyphococcus sp.]|uniref:FkbM family methyltransferase n=1 Tax=Hyphococcus sp. TaxID=2038636 RepID=UPI00208D286C|nr:MAG: methyltransferase FkbM [Marinicaulis sp.]
MKLERPTRNFQTFFDHLKERKKYVPAFCIDVGAAKGTTSIYEAFPKAHHIVFEPLPDFQAELRKTMAPYSHELHICALMDKPGEETLLRHPDRFGSSLMHQREDDGEDLVKVPVDTLDNVIGERKLKGGLLIKLDCQGSDLFVLKGGLKTLKQANIVIVEASLFPFWGEHQPVFYDIVKFMDERHFALYDILDGLYRPRDGALGQLDLVFVKKIGRFRNVHFW